MHQRVWLFRHSLTTVLLSPRYRLSRYDKMTEIPAISRAFATFISPPPRRARHERWRRLAIIEVA